MNHNGSEDDLVWAPGECVTSLVLGVLLDLPHSDTHALFLLVRAIQDLSYKHTTPRTTTT